jgi:hypothetical protein
MIDRYYNTSPDADRITAVRGQIDEVKSVMVQNIEKVLERYGKTGFLRCFYYKNGLFEVISL